MADYEQRLTGLLAEESVGFADAVHPEYQSRSAYGWIRRDDKLAVNRGKGRERLNLMAALCLESGDLELAETLKMSTDTAIELLARLERHHPKKRLIHVILDNAPVHRGQAVKAWLARKGCRIKLQFLPAYAPNLNAIECLWKGMPEQVAHNRYYASFRAFADAVLGFLKITLPQNWHPLRDQAHDTFHIVKPSEFRVIE